jgi:hypothetical protein
VKANLDDLTHAVGEKLRENLVALCGQAAHQFLVIRTQSFSCLQLFCFNQAWPQMAAWGARAVNS